MKVVGCGSHTNFKINNAKITTIAKIQIGPDTRLRNISDISDDQLEREYGDKCSY